MCEYDMLILLGAITLVFLDKVITRRNLQKQIDDLKYKLYIQ